MRILLLLFLTATTVQSACTCTGGTATVDSGSGATLCEADNTVDCSSCDNGYTISATAATGLQTCVANTCTCTGGMATVATGSGATLCEADNTVDCASCDDGYTISATAATGLQTCVVDPTTTATSAATMVKTPSYNIPLSIGGGVLVVVIISLLVYFLACKKTDKTPQNQITQRMLHPRTELDF